MVPFDIYRLQVTWGGATYPRPWLIVEVRPGDRYACFPIASECYGGNHCFWIDPTDADFAHTGLTKSCYIHYGCLIELDGAIVRAGVRKGCIQNLLLGAFRFRANV